MHAATARRAKTRMRLKPAAADPWQALPRLADLFDAQAPQLFFKGSKVPELEELALTETQLLEQTAALLGVSLAQLVRAAALVYAKREFLNHKKFSAAAQDGSEGGGGALLRSGSGVAGVADARIQAAYQTLADSKQPVTPAKLATRALTGYPTALRWLKIHHPELLLPKPPQPTPEAPKPETVPTEQGPKTAQSSQKQPEATPRKRGVTLKAQTLPKPLRNPKSHPELLADDPHLKTAQKQPEPARRHHDSAKAQKPAKRRRNPENEPF